MSDSEENEKNVRKGIEEASESGVSSDKTYDSSWQHKTLESFSFSFDEQQRMQREVLVRTMHEMNETTNQEIARQQAQFQQFFMRIQRINFFKQSGPLSLLPLLCHHQVQG